MYETLATQGRETIHTGLAAIDSSKLKKLRSSHLKECFGLIDEMRHKLEFVARIKGISFIDDAASRSALSTWYALETVEGSVVWIANGASSGSHNARDLKKLRTLVDSKVRMIVCLGDSSLYQDIFGDMVEYIIQVETMHEAVTTAFYSSPENIKILYSPAVENGISFDLEGERFKREVNEL